LFDEVRAHPDHQYKNHEQLVSHRRPLSCLYSFASIKANQRIIFVVERRSTAEILSRQFKEDQDFEQKNPDYVIGMSDSGFFKEMQQSILADFH
jgi:ERCC4-related helicase